MKNNVLVIFVKNLIPGYVKTRLAATLGKDAALDIYKQLCKSLNKKILSLEIEKIVFYSDFIEDDIWNATIFQKQIQQGNDLGERMENAFKSALTSGYKKAILIGTDCPGIDQRILKKAFAELDNFDVVIGPATDGGYYLLGMKKENPMLFRNVEWSTNIVLNQAIDLCNKSHLSYFLLPELSDIDEEKDLIHLKDLGFKI